MSPTEMKWRYNSIVHAVEGTGDGQPAMVIALANEQPPMIGKTICAMPELHRIVSYLADVYHRVNDRIEKRDVWTIRAGEDFAHSILSGEPDAVSLREFQKASFKTLQKESEMPAGWKFVADSGKSVIQDAKGAPMATIRGGSEEQRMALGTMIERGAATQKLAHYLLAQINESVLDLYSQQIGTDTATYNFVMELNAVMYGANYLLTGDVPEHYSHAVAVAMSGMFIEKNDDQTYQINLNSRLTGLTSFYECGIGADGAPVRYSTAREAQEVALAIFNRHNAGAAMESPSEEEEEAAAPAFN